MSIKIRKILNIAIIFSLCFLSVIPAQDTTKSLAFKKNRPYKNSPYYYQPDLSYQLLHQFKLIQMANSGDPLAQHELGLRLLTGEGIPTDTSTAVYWIKKAASQKLSAAQYNYGIMLLNGWGTDWNPFLAYEYFLNAAQSGMSQAQYVLGLLYTDNLIVRRDWNTSYFWTKKAYDGGFEPAKEILDQISSKVSRSFIDSVSSDKFDYVKNKTNNNSDDDKIQPSLGLVYIDFTENQDTVSNISDKILIQDLERIEIKNLFDTLGLKQTDSLLSSIKTNNQIEYLIELAESGSPEAMVLMGRLYETGTTIKMDLIIAAEYYVRATILDSHRAAYLLYKLMKQKQFLEMLISASRDNDAVAQFVWYGLHKLGYDNRLNDSDASQLLLNSANQKHTPALIELGFNYYTGKYFNLDKRKGIEIWKIAAEYGSLESDLRIIASRLYDTPEKVNSSDIAALKNYSEKGSLLAQVALANCYEKGIGINTNMALAAKYYRTATQRGNRFAYEQLKRIYDSIRPDSKTFSIND